MPSSLFHVAVGVLLGIAVLGDDADRKAVAVIAFAAFFPDVDTLLPIWFDGAHRAYLHNVFVFLVPATLLLVVRGARVHTRLTRWWPNGERVLWTAVMVLAVAGVGLDMTDSGVNLFYPVHDQFYYVSGTVMYSNQDGFRQTVFDPEKTRLGSTKERYYVSAVDTGPGPDPHGVERILLLFGSGTQLLISLTAFAIAGYRLNRRRFVRLSPTFRELVPQDALGFDTSTHLQKQE